MPSRRILALGLVTVAVMASLAPRAVAEPREHPVAVERFRVVVDGQVAEGHLAYPTDQLPVKLLVYGHGCCGRQVAQMGDRLQFARTQGAAVVAMDYRGWGGWDVATGAADVVAATAALQQRFPIQRTVAWGVSMGAEVTGMAVAARPDLFDWWVGTAGVYDLVEQWMMPGFRWLIEKETGGTPAAQPAAYRKRSPVHLAPAMRGLRGAFLVHGAGDPIVLQTQTWRMADALRGRRVPARVEVVPLGDRVEGPVLPIVGMTRVKAPAALAGHDGAVVARSAMIVGELLRTAHVPR